MEEKILISGKYNNKFSKLVSIILIVSLLIFTIAALCAVFRENITDDYFDSYTLPSWSKSKADFWNKMDALEMANKILTVTSIVGGAVFLILFIFLLATCKTEIVVTDKRVYGVTSFGKRVDLPMDSISAVALSVLNGIAVATSSGKISFIFITNAKDIHKTISDLLIERQNKKSFETTVKQEVPQNITDELKKYKELFDNGVITEEEFAEKKKQLLGL